MGQERERGEGRTLRMKRPMEGIVGGLGEGDGDRVGELVQLRVCRRARRRHAGRKGSERGLALSQPSRRLSLPASCLPRLPSHASQAGTHTQHSHSPASQPQRLPLPRPARLPSPPPPLPAPSLPSPLPPMRPTPRLAARVRTVQPTRGRPFKNDHYDQPAVPLRAVRPYPSSLSQPCLPSAFLSSPR